MPGDRNDNTQEKLRGFLDRVSGEEEMVSFARSSTLLKHMDRVPPGHHQEVLGILESFHALPQSTQHRLLPALTEVIGEADEGKDPTS